MKVPGAPPAVNNAVRKESWVVYLQLLRLCQLVAIAIMMAAAGLMIYHAVFTKKPGPFYMYNPFAPQLMAFCLCFECIGLFTLISNGLINRPCWSRIMLWIYWSIIAIASLISAIAWSISKRKDSAVVQILAFVVALCALPAVALSQKIAFGRTQSQAEPKGCQCSVCAHCYYSVCCKALDFVLKLAHTIFAILFAVGAIRYCLYYRFENPGKIYPVKLADMSTSHINVYCTDIASTQPTIWFQGGQPYGITAFLGIQTYLENEHKRASCSYDQLSFGWSSPAPKNVFNSSMYWEPLLDRLGRIDEPYVAVAWDGALEDVVYQVLQHPHTVRGLVAMDSGPPGVEYMSEVREDSYGDESARFSWDEEKMLDMRKKELAKKQGQIMSILTFGISWGLTPTMMPKADPNAYFNKTEYPRHRAQYFKEDMWSFQYYSLLAKKNQEKPSTFLNNTSVPDGIPVYSLIERNSRRNMSATSAFMTAMKRDVVSGIAGGKDKVKGWGWCEDEDCGSDFPIRKARWTAQALVDLGI